MRKIFWASLGICLVLGAVASVRADDKDDVKAVIDKAIKARGGEEKLAKYKAFTIKSKGKINLMGNEIEFTNETAVQIPDKMRSYVEGEFGGVKFTRIQVVNGNKGWLSQMGNTEEMNEEQLNAAKEEQHAGRVVTLVPLKDPAFTLAPLGEVKVGDRPAVGVKVSHKGQKDINLYFDKEKGLLLKTQRRVKDMMTGQELDQETLFSNYKEVDGVQHPMKQTIKRDGNDFLTIEISEYKSHDKLDDKLFSKPSE
jgi:hypothetical protein